MPVTSNEAYVTFSVKVILDQDRHLNVRLIVDEVRIPKLIHLIIIEIYNRRPLCAGHDVNI